MTLQGYVSNFNDPDLVPSNVKNLVKIFDVEGDFTGIGGAGVEYLCNPDNYFIMGSYQPDPQYHIEGTNYICCLYGAGAGSYGGYYVMGYIPKSGVMKILPAGAPYSIHQIPDSSSVNIATVYKDGDILHVNFTDGGSGIKHDDFNTATGVWTGASAGHITTGVLQTPSLSISYLGMTLTMGRLLIDSSASHYTMYCNIT